MRVSRDQENSVLFFFWQQTFISDTEKFDITESFTQYHPVVLYIYKRCTCIIDSYNFVDSLFPVSFSHPQTFLIATFIRTETHSCKEKKQKKQNSLESYEYILDKKKWLELEKCRRLPTPTKCTKYNNMVNKIHITGDLWIIRTTFQI